MLGGLQWRAASRRRSSAARQHVHVGHARQALCRLLIVYPGCHRWAEPSEAAECWPCIGGGLDAARQCGRDAFRGACSHLRWWRMNGACCGTCLWKRIVWRSHKVKSPHVNTDLRSGVDSHEATCERHGANAGRHVADWGCRVSRRAIDAPCENLSSLLPALWCTRL